jgi:hypothetical protein
MTASTTTLWTWPRSKGAPDNLVGVVNSHRELLFPGTDTLEIWYDSGDADFPFARQGNAFIERGCIDARLHRQARQQRPFRRR